MIKEEAAENPLPHFNVMTLNPTLIQAHASRKMLVTGRSPSYLLKTLSFGDKLKMMEISMRDFAYIINPVKLLTPKIVQMVSSIHEHKGRQELFLEANIGEMKMLLEVAIIQSTGASNRIEGIFTSDKRLEELVSQKAESCNRSEQEIVGFPVYPSF